MTTELSRATEGPASWRDPQRSPRERALDLAARMTLEEKVAQLVVATLKHFAGYSASRAGRNLAAVTMGPRDLADVDVRPVPGR